MNIEVRCPYGTSNAVNQLVKCNTVIKCFIDTQGDPDVGMQPIGLENVEGTCVHADGINSDLENEGRDRVKVLWPTFAGALDDALDARYREEFQYYSHDEEEADNDSAR